MCIPASPIKLRSRIVDLYFWNLSIFFNWNSHHMLQIESGPTDDSKPQNILCSQPRIMSQLVIGYPILMGELKREYGDLPMWWTKTNTPGPWHPPVNCWWLNTDGIDEWGCYQSPDIHAEVGVPILGMQFILQAQQRLAVTFEENICRFQSSAQGLSVLIGKSELN